MDRDKGWEVEVDELGTTLECTIGVDGLDCADEKGPGLAFGPS